MRGIELRPALGGDRIDDRRLIVGLVVPHEVRPPVVPRAASLIDLIVAARSASDRIHICIGTYFAPIEESGVLVHGDPIRIAVAHRVNLRSRLRCSWRKEISRGDGVRPVRLRVDADDLPAQIVRVSGRFLGVPWQMSWTLVDGCIAAGERIGVVAGGDIEVSLGVEGDGASGVTALQALSSHLEKNLPRRQVERVSFHCVASEHVLRLGAGRRVVHVDPAVRREVGIGGETEQPVLRLRAVRVFGADRDRCNSSHATRLWSVEVDEAVSLDEQHALAGKDGELHWFVQRLGENHFREAVLLWP